MVYNHTDNVMENCEGFITDISSSVGMEKRIDSQMHHDSAFLYKKSDLCIGLCIIYFPLVFSTLLEKPFSIYFIRVSACILIDLRVLLVNSLTQ